MLIPLRSVELGKLIPPVATGNQFKSALGNPQKILQRVLISTIGGVITLLLSQSQIASSFYSVWLIIGVSFLLYILWGPIVEAGQINAKLRKYNFTALFDGYIVKIFTKEKIENRHEQASKTGKLEFVESRRTWMFLELEDDEGYLGTLSFPMDKSHNSIREGLNIKCLVFSDRKDFSKILALSDGWIPSRKLWVGEYPYLLRPAFEEICSFRLIR